MYEKGEYLKCVVMVKSNKGERKRGKIMIDDDKDTKNSFIHANDTTF